MRAPCHVGECLVDGDALDRRREIAQDRDGGIAEPLIFVEMSGDKHEVGTELPRAPSRHAASYAEGSRFIRSREHDAAADRNRLAAQARVKQLLDRRIKGVQVRVENGGCGTHLVDSSPWTSLRDDVTDAVALDVCPHVDRGEPVGPSVVHLGATRYTHHSAEASLDSSSAGPTPRRSATGAPDVIKRFSSVVNTRKRSKEARVKASRRAAV